MVTVSVIIPCFNHGKYLDEAVESVLKQTYDSFEIIIVNDGSTDKYTIDKLNSFSKPKTRIIHTENKGPSHARNTGIMNAEGIYILPLDADDKIANTYLEKALNVFNNMKNIGIVYCDAYLFGNKYHEEIWDLPPYSLEDMLINNVIFASAFFRKSDWEKVSGYDEELIYGDEDYDFWLKIIEFGVQAYKIPEVLFYYRYLDNSRSRQITDEQLLDFHVKIFNKHKQLFLDNYKVLVKNKIYLEQQIKILQNDKVVKLLKKIKFYSIFMSISDAAKFIYHIWKSLLYYINWEKNRI